MADQLKALPCPICNGAGESGTDRHSGVKFAGCANVDCIAYRIAYDFATIDAAIAAWNTRTNTPESSNSPASNGAAQGAMRELAYELEGVIQDVESGNYACDSICMDTIKRVRNALLQPSDATAQPIQLRNLIADDAFAMTFQSLGQYRKALLANTNAQHSPAQGKPEQCPTCRGNDADAPCAYPSCGMTGCLRDKRLAAKKG